MKALGAWLFFAWFHSGKLDFDFSALAGFWWGQHLFNEKELQGGDGSVPRSGLPDAQFFDGLSNFPPGLMCLFYSQKCSGPFVSEGLLSSNSEFGISTYSSCLCLSSIPICSAGFTHTIKAYVWHIISILSTQRTVIKLIVLFDWKDSHTLNIMYALFFLFY